jgi:thymidylate kinase
MARLLGYSKRHYNQRSKSIVIEQCYDQWQPMRIFLPPLFGLDMILTAWWNVLLPLRRGEWVLCDRYVLDAIVDISTILNDLTLLENNFAARLIRLLPPNACSIILDIDPSLAFARKLDLLDLAYVSTRRPLYLRLARRMGIPIIDGNRGFDEVQRSIAEIVGICPLPEQRGILPKVSS